MNLRQLYTQYLPKSLRRWLGPILKLMIPSRLIRRYRYRQHGLKGTATEALRMLIENDKVYPYQPLFGMGPQYADIFGKFERTCNDRWEAIRPFLPISGTALDLGSQHGFFTFYLAQIGLYAIGIERDLTAYRLSQLLTIINNCHHVAFFHEEIDLQTVRSLPAVDMVLCLSIFHHWVREHDLEYAREIMKQIVSRCRSTLVFETGQNNENHQTFPKILSFMGNDPRSWIIEFLKSLGFSKVACLGEYSASHISAVPRYLFIAQKQI